MPSLQVTTDGLNSSADCPQSTMVHLQLFYFQWCKSNMHSIETVLQFLHFGPSWTSNRPLRDSLKMLGKNSELRFPVNYTTTRANNPDAYNHSVPISPFIQYSIQPNIWDTNTLIYIGFVLDKLAQLKANVRFPVTISGRGG